MSLIAILITLLVAAIIIYVVKLIIDMIPMDPPAKTIVYLIFGVAVLLWLLNYFSLYSTQLK